MYVYVINLEKDQDKWKTINQELGYQHGIQPIRIDAIYGKTLENKILKASTTPLNYYFASPGLIGCFLSHKKAWKTLLTRDDPWALVLEDDAKILVPDLQKSIHETLNNIPEDFDLCYFGCHGKCHPDKEYRWDKKYLSVYQKINGYRISPNLFVPEVASGTYGYLVSRKGAQKLMQFIKKVKHPIDMELSTNFDKLKVYAVHPNIIGFTHDEGSNMASPDRPILSFLSNAHQLKTNYYQYQILSYPLNLYSIAMLLLGIILGLISFKQHNKLSPWLLLGFYLFYIIVNCQMLRTQRGRQLLLGDLIVVALGYSLFYIGSSLLR